MRKLFLLVLACFSGGCAYEGTIVRKEVRPLPFSYSLGLDAIYDFELRGSDGQLHRQMVPAAVFANYEVGDYFSEFQPPARVERAPFMPDFWPPARPLEDQGTRYPMQVPLPPDPASR